MLTLTTTRGYDMKYEYTIVYRIRGINHKSPVDLETLASDNGSIRAVVTRTPDRFDGGAKDEALLGKCLAEWLEEHKQAPTIIEQCRNLATTSRKTCEDAPHVVIQICGDRPDLDGKEIRETDTFVVHLNPHDPSESIRMEAENHIGAVLVSLALESGGALTLDKVWDSIVMIRGDGKRTIPLNCSNTMEIFDYDSLEADATTRITACYRRLCGDKQRELGTVSKLLKCSLESEKDRLRSFLFAWAAIEIFVNKVFAKYEEQMFKQLGSDLHSDRYHLPIQHIREVMKNRYTLATKFHVVAVQLYAHDADKDADTFRQAKKARNDLFHGSSVDEATLPVIPVRDVLVKYLQLHLGGHVRPATDKRVMRISGRFDPSRHKH
jgi:hypothetical protein